MTAEYNLVARALQALLSHQQIYDWCSSALRRIVGAYSM